MTKQRKPIYSPWQQAFIDELKEIARHGSADLHLTSGPKVDGDTGEAIVGVRLRVEEIACADGGLQLGAQEDFLLRIGRSPLAPPSVEVEHTRLLGYPHVLQGQRLCIFLDPSREWDPDGGAAVVLTRLWDWLTDAAGARFDASTAMYHAVGGVLHRTENTPTIVVREDGPSKRQQVARLVPRTDDRYDLSYSTDAGSLRVPVLTLGSDLPFGASSTLALLLRLLDDPYLDQHEGCPPRVAPQAQGFITMLTASAIRNPVGTEQYFLLAVPHPAGGPAHLLAGRLPRTTSDTLRKLGHKYGVSTPIDVARIDTTIPVQWCSLSDERPSVTSRRDDKRPVNGFIGRTVHVWGCGGLGSWIAEYIARAGAASITLCDPGTVTGGLLVRQNYNELDIGMNKAVALANRLNAIRDDLLVDAEPGAVPADSNGGLDADLIIDATVNLSIGRLLDQLADQPSRRALIAQAATDARSGTLGIVSVCPPGSPLRPTQIDARAGSDVLARSDLELYHSLWQEPLTGHELIPTRGCSAPTFHGSAADLAAVGAALTNFVGLHLQSTELSVGTHLVALPHADEGPRHAFIPLDLVESAARSQGRT